MIKGILVFFILVLIFILIIHILNYELKKRTTKIRILNKKLLNELEQRKKMTNDIILTLIKGLGIYDEYTKGHSENVAKYSLLMAKALNFNQVEIESCYYSALLHDLGKVKVPNEIIAKKGKLSNREYEIIKTHSFYSYRILKEIESFDLIAKNVLYHHERFDGLGYPEGIIGNEIPIISRIISIADAYDAMTSNRIYRNKLTKDQALNELINCSGSQFDPQLVDIFVKEITKNEIDYILNSESKII